MAAIEEVGRRLGNRKITKKYLVLHGGADSNLIGPVARAHGFEVIDFFQVMSHFQLYNKKVPVDGHPAPEVYWYLAEVLRRQLGKDFPGGTAISEKPSSSLGKASSSQPVTSQAGRPVAETIERSNKVLLILVHIWDMLHLNLSCVWY